MMLMFGMSETTDQLVMVNSLRWYDSELRKEGCDGLVSALIFVVEIKMEKMRSWKNA